MSSERLLRYDRLTSGSFFSTVSQSIPPQPTIGRTLSLTLHSLLVWLQHFFAVTQPFPFQPVPNQPFHEKVYWRSRNSPDAAKGHQLTFTVLHHRPYVFVPSSHWSMPDRWLSLYESLFLKARRDGALVLSPHASKRLQELDCSDAPAFPLRTLVLPCGGEKVIVFPGPLLV